MNRFEPDYKNVVDAANNVKPARFPLYEHVISFIHMEKALGGRISVLFNSRNTEDLKEFHRQHASFYRKMGYDTVTWESCIITIFPGGGALGSHQPGIIKTREDFERYPWNQLEQMYFEAWSPHFEALGSEMPEGMKAIGGVGNGVFECVQDLVGYENLCLLLADDPGLFQDLFEKVGQVSFNIWKRFMAEYGDMFCVLRFGDDLGYKGGTLLSPQHIRQLIIPQYRRIIDLVHSYKKPFLLHSCGCLFEVMDAIIEDGRIDAKHSNEDVIAPFSSWLQKYGDRIGNFGGIDMNVLCLDSLSEIEAYTLNVLKYSSDCGGVAFGSGNSIPDYIPFEGYLTMVNTIRKFRGDQEVVNGTT